MPGCERYVELLAARLEDAAGGEERGLVDQHLAVCAGCRDTLAAAEALLAIARSAPVPDPGPGYWRSFTPALRQRLAAGEPAPRWVWLWRPAVGFASVAFLALGLLWLRSPVIHPPPPAVVSDTASLTELYNATEPYDALTDSDEAADLPVSLAWNAADTSADWSLVESPNDDSFSFLDLEQGLSAEDLQILRDALVADAG